MFENFHNRENFVTSIANTSIYMYVYFHVTYTYMTNHFPIGTTMNDPISQADVCKNNNRYF